MPYLNFLDPENKNIGLYYDDQGNGIPLVFIHGWPVSSQMWENQVNFLAGKGFRCIRYDRRGFGHSDKPWGNFTYDVLAADLDTLIRHLNLQDVILIGFSMGGGEVVRYISSYGSERVLKAVLISSVVPGLLKSDHNPNGASQSVFDNMLSGVTDERQQFMSVFGKNFFGWNKNDSQVSNEILQWHWNLCMQADLHASLECINSFSKTDFMEELSGINLPVLLIHGGNDAIVPVEISSGRTHKLLSSSELKIYEGAPHGLYITHKNQLNLDLLQFFES